jgi:hypothetical protein
MEDVDLRYKYCSSIVSMTYCTLLQASTVPKVSSNSTTVDPRKRKHEAASASSSSSAAPASSSVDPVPGTASTVDLGGDSEKRVMVLFECMSLNESQSSIAESVALLRSESS